MAEYHFNNDLHQLAQIVIYKILIFIVFHTYVHYLRNLQNKA